MSIRKKVTVFTVVTVVFPMAAFFLLSTFVFEKIIEKSAENYLGNASQIVRSLMLGRLDALEKGCVLTAKSDFFRQYVKIGDAERIGGQILNLREVYQYLDFVMVFDADKKLLASYPDVKSTSPRLLRLVRQAEQTRQTVKAEEMFSLTDLFPKDSPLYNKFRITLPRKDGSPEYFTKCLAGVTIVPVYDKEQLPVGFLAAGNIANNDDFIPASYSKSVEGSYMALSVDGVRVCSNIRSPQRENFVGSATPISMQTLEGQRAGTFGSEINDGETHYFVDGTIVNSGNEVIGAYGVGIPQYKLSGLMYANKWLIIVITGVCLGVMLLLGQYLAKRIIRPITAATEFARQIAGENSRRRENAAAGATARQSGEANYEIDEIALLLTTMREMDARLRERENEIKSYIKKIEYEHSQQKLLDEQLKSLNEELEQKVAERTRDLYEMMTILKNADEVKSQFLTNMSHELRTPLSSIIYTCQTIGDEILGSLNQMQHKHIRNMLDSGTHLLQIINDILDIAKIGAGKMVISPKIYLIEKLIKDSISAVDGLAQRKNLTVALDGGPAGLLLKVDAGKFRQIMYNLLSNAIKFTPENGRVSVRVTKGERQIRVSVKDNGVGISEEDQKRVFEEFEQVENSYEKTQEGTGLGLPLAKKLVELHGGAIFLISKQGEGTEVFFSLPLSPQETG